MIGVGNYSISPKTLVVIAEFMFAVASSKRGLASVLVTQPGLESIEQRLPATGHLLRTWVENGQLLAELTIEENGAKPSRPHNSRAIP